MKNVKEICIAVFFIVVIVIRFNIPDDNVSWISTVNYTGLLVSVIDLLYDTYKCSKKENNVFIAVCVVILLMLMVPLALLCTNFINITPKINDFFTLSALLLTLSKNVWRDFIIEVLLK